MPQALAGSRRAYVRKEKEKSRAQAAENRVPQSPSTTRPLFLRSTISTGYIAQGPAEEEKDSGRCRGGYLGFSWQ